MLRRREVRPAGLSRHRPHVAPAGVAVAPAAVLLVLGLVQLLHDPPLWYDEAYSRLAAGVPITTLLEGIWHRTGVIGYLMDVPPSFNGPYYVLLHYWVAVFGDSEISLRLPSLLCAVGAVAALAVLARRLAGPWAGLFAGMLCATAPLMTDESAQARSYGPAMLALTLCALGLERWLRTGRGARRTVAAGAVAGLLHWFALPVLAGFALSAVLLRWRRGGGRLAVGLGLGCLPAGALVGWSLLGGTYGAPSPPAVGWSLAWHAVLDWSGGVTALAVLTVAAALVGLWRSPHRVLLACWVVVPLLLVTAVELVRPTYYPRYLLFTLLGLALAAGVGLASLPSLVVAAGSHRRGRRVVRAAATVVVAVMVGLSLSAAVPHLSDGAREPSQAALGVLATQQSVGEPIVPADGRTSLDLETYIATAPRLQQDLVLPPTLFTDQTSSRVVWLVRVVLQQGSLPVVPAEQRLIDAGWTQESSTLLVGTTTNLRVERWVR